MYLFTDTDLLSTSLTMQQAKPYLSDRMAEMLVDRRLGNDYDIVQLKRLAFAASLCIRPTAILRPSMNEVHIWV